MGSTMKVSGSVIECHLFISLILVCYRADSSTYS